MKKRILILDDKETIAKVLSIYLMAEYDGSAEISGW